MSDDKERVTILIRKTQYEQLKEIAGDKDRSISSIIRGLLEDYLSKEIK